MRFVVFIYTVRALPYCVHLRFTLRASHVTNCSKQAQSKPRPLITHTQCSTLLTPCRFLYQVFPGTLSQCQRLLLRVARVGETSTIRKLVCVTVWDCGEHTKDVLSSLQLLFFHKNKPFVNFPDPESGNTALHLASRHGHIVSPPPHTHAHTSSNNICF